MVRLYKVPSEFNICRMRDSFLRQFTDQETGAESGSEDEDTGTNTNEMKVVSTIHQDRYKSTSARAQRKQAVTNIIR